MRTRVHRTVFVALVCLLVIAMTTSVFMANLLWTLLLVNWIAEWNWREKFADFRHNYLLQAFLVLLGVHLLWLVGTHNMHYALFDLQKKLPLFLIPLVLLTTPRLNAKEAHCVAGSYVGTILVVTFIGLVRYLTLPDLPYRNIVPYISHIRFGLNICMALALILYAAFHYRKPWVITVGGLMGVWFVLFLLLIHAYTAFFILACMALVGVLGYRRLLPKPMRWGTTLGVGCLLGLGIGLTAYYVADYYRLRPLSTQPEMCLSANGNPYQPCLNDMVENGNYIYRHICEAELRQEWAKRSSQPLDSLSPVGYPVYPALVRYLNSIGATKDSAGLAALTPEDISAIEKGIANRVYLQHGPRKMVYVLCYEYESYRCYRSVSNFTMLQRFELWRNGWQVFCQHPLLGVGTGDVVDQCHAQMRQNRSPLADTNLHTHNQYLNLLIAFGLVGFTLILFMFVRALWRNRSCRSVLFGMFLCILLLSCCTEDTLETLAGITFAALGFALLCPRYPINKKQFNK